MKTSQARLTPYTLPLQRQWQSKRQKLATRSGWLLEISDSNGIKGYGDCAPLPTHGTETLAEALTTLESRLPNLTNVLALDALKELPDTSLNPAARCAIETALLDLITKQKAIPLYKWLNPKSEPMVRVNATLGALDKTSPKHLASAIERGYSLLKYKVGISEPANEIEMLNRLCDELPSSAQLRLDANRSWDMATAESFLRSMSQMPIESLEEPLAQPDINQLKQLQETTDITLALDETLSEIYADSLQQLKPLRRIILKPMVLGGLLPSLNIAQEAQLLGMETVVTTTVDSAAGVWAATQLAAALDPEGKICHGLATGEWLQQDLGEGPVIKNGAISIPSGPGLGFTPYD